jgi:hypothetical protein
MFNLENFHLHIENFSLFDRIKKVSNFLSMIDFFGQSVAFHVKDDTC